MAIVQDQTSTSPSTVINRTKSTMTSYFFRDCPSQVRTCVSDWWYSKRRMFWNERTWSVGVNTLLVYGESLNIWRYLKFVGSCFKTVCIEYWQASEFYSKKFSELRFKYLYVVISSIFDGSYTASGRLFLGICIGILVNRFCYCT